MIRFGYVLKLCREDRGLSLRELKTLSGIDHAYIHRLETSTKLSPSEEVFTSLVRALKVSTRMRDILDYLCKIEGVPDALFDAMQLNEGHSILAFETASKMSFRGERPSTVEDWDKLMGELDDKFFQ